MESLIGPLAAQNLIGYAQLKSFYYPNRKTHQVKEMPSCSFWQMSTDLANAYEQEIPCEWDSLDGHTPWSAGWKVYGPPRLSHLEMEAGMVYTSSQLVEEEKSGLWQRAGGQRVWGGCAESVFSAVTRCGWEPDSGAEWILPSIISHGARLPGRSGYGAPTGGHLHAVDSEGKVLSRMN